MFSTHTPRELIPFYLSNVFAFDFLYYVLKTMILTWSIGATDIGYMGIFVSYNRPWWIEIFLTKLVRNTAKNFQWWLLEGGILHSATSTLAVEAGFRAEHLDFELRDPRNYTTPLAGAAGGGRPLVRAIICPRI